LGDRIGRFQFKALLETVILEERSSNIKSHFLDYLEKRTGLKIESCWIDVFQWTYRDQKWRKDFHVEKYNIK
jgi:hypothetical protein